jgi:alpha-galactosidase
LDYASWGVDYLKYDNCNSDDTPGIERYTRMTEALNKTGKPIYYSLCNWGLDAVWSWGNITGNSWRTTFDISNNWVSMK